MAYGLQDVLLLRQMQAASEGDEQYKKVERHKLEAMLALCEDMRCRRQALLAYFGEVLEQPCGHCDNCTEEVRSWDATEAARMALSAIYRSGQRYGVGYLTDILLGRETERILASGHQRLAMFGIGKSLSEGEWRILFRQLIARGLVDVEVEGFSSLRLNERCRSLLRGEVRLELRHDVRIKGNRKKGTTSAAAHLLEAGKRPLWERLRALRKSLAEQHGVPPYVIFPDSTLLEMLHRRPADLMTMAQISGVGALKLERYGEAFLEVLGST